MIIWLASYPRSGNTFFRVVLDRQFNYLTPSIYPKAKQRMNEVLESPTLPDSLESLAKSDQYYIIKTHELPADDYPAIYLVRDGRDCLISYAWFSLMNWQGIDQKDISRQQLETRLQELIVTNAHFSNWSNHIDQWTTRSAPTSVVRFENLIANPIETVRSACQEVGLALQQTDRPLPSFEELHTSSPIFYRSGKTKTWKTEMPERLHRMFWLEHGAMMTRMNYLEDQPEIAETDRQFWQLLKTSYQQISTLQSELQAKENVIQEQSQFIKFAQQEIESQNKDLEKLRVQRRRDALVIKKLRKSRALDSERLVAKEQVIVKLLKYRQWSLRYWGGKLARSILPQSVILKLVKRVRRIHYGLTKPRLLSLQHHPPRRMKLPDHYYQQPPGAANLPTISIVTPSYNHAAFIEKTIRSVLAQNYPRLEYIIQDAASSDGTQAILQKYADQLAHVESKPDGGQTNAVNIGLRKSSGEIMAYLNSDDILLPGALHTIGEYFAAHPDVDAVYGHRIMINEQDQEIGRWLIPDHQNEIQRWVDFIPQETLFWRRSVWEKVGEFDESFRFALDWDYILRMQDAGARFVRLPRFLGGFRIHENQKTLAMQDVGMAEMARIRTRIHGYEPMWTEIESKIREYYRENVRLHILHRFGLIQ
jgi:glycosyltransferase involved in cell wall biosynthesis